MKNIDKIIACVVGLVFVIVIVIVSFIRVKSAKVNVVLENDLTISFNSHVRVSDFIKDINGHIVNDYVIDTTSLGKKEVSFNYINDDNIKVRYKYYIEVVDNTPPVIWLDNSYSVLVNSSVNLLDKIMCGDDVDNNPTCYIEGYYNQNEVGVYPLVFHAIDKSGNHSIKNFNLYVREKTNNNNYIEEDIISFQDVLRDYKTSTNRIGIDVSSWQGDIDFEKVKSSGVSFVMIRVGITDKKTKDIVIDEYFLDNIKKATDALLDVGVYFYSRSNSSKDAKREAKWVIEQIKDYDISLPVAFDWEDWNNFNSYNLSFYSLTNVAISFMKTIEENGYTPIFYSSKTYLENIWFQTDYPVWLAHYTKKTNYSGDYKMWQITNKGRVDGIDTLVDIDIMY